MVRGLKVAGGDRLGKTIIFAKNHAHAEFIAERFNANYPHYKGEFARVIDFQVDYAQTLINNFSHPNKPPHIAISVDMLDTGIDVPEVVNLMFFKLVRSKTKFWQMIGRGTRLCPDLFGPGKHKEFFFLFDYCANLEFFSQNMPTTDGVLGESVSKRLFKARLELMGELDAQTVRTMAERQPPELVLRRDIGTLLRTEVAAMNVNNFVVRPHRRLVEQFSKEKAWGDLTPELRNELANQVAGLPTELDPEDEEAKRFDLLVLNLQLALLRDEPFFTRLQDQVKAIAGLLEEKAAIPMVAKQMPLIQELQTDEWWVDVTVVMLESVRKSIRALVKLIEKQKRKPVYTDFEDELGADQTIELPGFASPDSYERFLAKTRMFLREHESDAAIQKLRMNEPLTAADLQSLEQLLANTTTAKPEYIAQAKTESHGLGLFVRSLVGMNREAAKNALAGFVAGKTLNASQIEFVNMIIDHLTEHGVMEASLLYESPFTDIVPQGPDELFTGPQVDELMALLDVVRQRATVN